ncbi:Nudix family hydrolase [Candidimonas nitroreducens]|uniref:8-oxo-dGTP diphosphatase n=1 Tax=Candidimonas nitroreducens TaxID=683354 RepID=A0A225MCI6_9BURK|nr:Nudix family hydrolase [Candidimonas nitroreducens]OWT58995.1 NUDIX hydrolase [Candidimonas nitroreducens]
MSEENSGKPPQPDTPAKPLIHVAAGMILRADGALLLAERPADKPWPGWWELPGGKIEPGETVLQALARELDEELGIQVTQATPWVTHVHEYPKNIVSLAFCRVTGWNGTPTGREGQTLAWVDPHAPITVGKLLPATEPPLRWLRLPDRYLITAIGGPAQLAGYLARLDTALRRGIRLVQFREPAWQQQGDEQGLAAAFQEVLRHCHEHGARCLVNSVHPQDWWDQADGVHLRAADATKLAARPGGLLGMSAHDAADLALARELGADFAVLGHVLDTPSHPGEPGMGWERYAGLAGGAGLPVLAIGGQSEATLDEARRHGAHGIAGIRHLLAG